jgi:Fe-S-cluster containining protein
MIVKLPRPFTGPNGSPIIDRVDTLIFSGGYIDGCMRCTFCHDSCCAFGVDVDVENVERLKEIEAKLAEYTGVATSEWYQPGFHRVDDDYPGGEYKHMRVKNDRCVFVNRNGRGCRLHAFCLDMGHDYHRYKPLICWLFPLTYDKGLLHPSIEIFEKSLACQDKGTTTFYQGVRDEVRVCFGQELVDWLDQLEAEVSGAPLGESDPARTASMNLAP